MDLNGILEEVRKIILLVSPKAEKDTIKISKDTVLVGKVGENQLDISSIEYIEIIAVIEQKFNIEFDFEVKLTTVGEWVDYIYLNSI